MRLIPPVLLLLICLAACSPHPGGGPEAIPVPTATHEPAQAASETVQPITAEEALYVFLTAYENNPDEMLPFLSQSLRDHLPSEGIPGLLGFQGTLEGLIFTSGTTASDPNLALIEARLQVDGEEVERVFYLERQSDNWVITSIEQVEE